MKKKSEFETWHYKQFGLWPNETMLYRGYNLRAAFNVGRRVERPIKWMSFAQAVKKLAIGDLILAAHYPWPDNRENVEFVGGTFAGVVPSGHISCKHGWSHQLIYSDYTIAIARIGNRKVIWPENQRKVNR